MVRNKEELVEAANAWLDVAQNDIRKHAIAFMESTGVDAETLADILDTDVEIVNGMIEGTCDIPMSVFAKILIATNNCIVIVPADEMPRHGGMTPRGQRPMGGMRPQMPRVGGGFTSTATPRHTEETRQRPSQPARDARGRFIPRQQPNTERMPNGFPMPNPNGQLPPPEEFMRNMPRTPWGFPTPTNNEPRMEEDAPTPRREDASPEDKLAKKLARALRDAPELANLFQRIIDED